MKPCRQFFEKVVQFLKKRWWYIFILIISTLYVLKYRYEIYQLKELNAQNLIFILWLILLGMPLFSEIEIGSIKLKKEIEKTRNDVKESVNDLKYQILEMKVTNSNTFVVNNPPLPSKDELSQMQKSTKYDESTQVTTSDFNISDDNVYLFQVRLSLEKQLSALCNVFGYDDRRSIYSMAQFLVQHEVFDRNTAGLIREIINIANRGVHGEIIDEDYLKFVKRTYPAIKQALEHEYAFYSHNNYYFECPKCKYRGPSKYHNVCPKCGMAVDD